MRITALVAISTFALDVKKLAGVPGEIVRIGAAVTPSTWAPQKSFAYFLKSEDKYLGHVRYEAMTGFAERALVAGPHVVKLALLFFNGRRYHFMTLFGVGFRLFDDPAAPQHLLALVPRETFFIF